jgi:hypothetical protein
MAVTPYARWIGLGMLAGSLSVATAGTLRAQEEARPAAERPVPGPVEAMARHARSIRVGEADGSPSARPIPLRPEPILRYDDKPRNIMDATLWAWGTRGRPAAILKVESYPHNPADRRWLYGIVSLSPELIRVEGDEAWSWSSSRPGLDLRDVPRAPEPAGTEALRLVQMREIARRFEAHEDAGPARGRLQLRLLPRPVDRYADPASGLQDGAIFGFAYGTNPDLLLVVESRPQGDPAPRWRYGLARLGGGETFVSLDGQEVWSQPGANPPARKETYMNRRQRDRDEP